MGRAKRPGIDKIEESWVKDKTKKRLEEFSNIHVDMPPANMYGASGRHDFLITQKALSWTIETKAGAGKPTENQIRFALSIEKGGGISILVNEFNLELVTEVATYIDTHNCLPYHLAHDFRQWRNDSKK